MWADIPVMRMTGERERETEEGGETAKIRKEKKIGSRPSIEANERVKKKHEDEVDGVEGRREREGGDGGGRHKSIE